jgi:cyclophilin family peptidyl-prolyl cis-trans isomerase
VFLKYGILIALIISSLISCGKNYQTISLNDEYKKGVSLDKIVTLKSNEIIVAKIETSLGLFEIELYNQDAPKTVKNFVGLAVQGYYDGLIFHRVIKDFMIQTGDSTGTGEGGKSIYGKEFEDEFSTKLLHSEPGVVSMANKGPASNLSQFFITTAAANHLDGRHTIFGKVTDGMDVVYAISNVKTGDMDRPVEKVIMRKVTIEKHIY